MPLMIKSPQLYRLSYRPKFQKLIAYLARRFPSASRIVSPVYPSRSPGRDLYAIPAPPQSDDDVTLFDDCDDILAAWRRWS